MTECACQECILRRKLAALRESGTRDDLLAFCDQMLELWGQECGDQAMLKACGIAPGDTIMTFHGRAKLLEIRTGLKEFNALEGESALEPQAYYELPNGKRASCSIAWCRSI